MILIDDPIGLLYIEPIGLASTEPVIDQHTRHMAGVLTAHTETGALMRGVFHAGVRMRGVHSCRCGVMSSNVDYLLEGGMVTNSLAVHYLAYHRDEVPELQLAQVAALPKWESNPTLEQLAEPPRNQQRRR